MHQIRFLLTNILISGLLVSTILTGCSRRQKQPEYYPYENLLTIAGDCRRFLRADIYRFPYPEDPSGQNFYKSSLVRLANYEKIYPDRFTEVISYLKGRLYQRLGDYEQAMHHFRIVSAMNGELALLAEEWLEISETFHTVCDFNIDADTARDYILQYETQIEALGTLVEKCRGLEAESEALVEKEKAEVDFAVFLQDNRHILPGGAEKAFQAWNDIIEEHPESKNIQSHRIHLADFYFTLAKDYASWKPPERIGFEWSVFESYVGAARRIYYQVTLQDGYPEKPEAKAKLEALLSFMENVRRKSR